MVAENTPVFVAAAARASSGSHQTSSSDTPIKTLKHYRIQPDTIIILLLYYYDEMNKAVLSRIKHAIIHNLDEKASQIIKQHGSFLSKRDISQLIRYMLAYQKSPCGVVRYILYESIHRNKISREEYDYIVRAAGIGGYANTMRMLLGDVRLSRTNLKQTMVMASQRGYAEVVRILLADNRSDPSVSNDNAIRLASSNGHVDVVRILLEDGRANLNANDDEVIWCACSGGHVDVVRALLADGRADPSADYSRSIRSASWKGHSEIVRMLLEDGRVDPSTYTNSALYGAVQLKLIDVVQILMLDSRVYQAGFNGLASIAWNNGSRNIVDLFVSYGAPAF